MIWDFLKSGPFWALIGVIVGSLLTTVKDVFLDRRNQTRLATYAAIRIVCVLDLFTEGCLSVATDGGEDRPQPHGQAEREPTVDEPVLGPFASDIDWKSLSPEMAYKILIFPSKIDEAERSIHFAFDMIGGPPDYAEGFEERQIQYAELGLAAIEITNELRERYSIAPLSNESPDWGPAKRLPEIKNRIDQSREAERHRREAIFGERASAELS
ncbi:hypothetical protein [Xanthobacter autotrophicus]|uniref:hypothetical protein n=1 Tax=Xanthobacter autotrophicus TaxID=280 RepID=UPI00372CE398